MQNNFNYQDLLIASEGKLFLHPFPRLPKPPLLMFDRVTFISNTGGTFDKGLIEAELDIKPEAWFFKCHFTEDPVMPGCLGLDALWQLLGFFLAREKCGGYGRALGTDSVKFRGQILPTNKLVIYRVNIKKFKQNPGFAIANGEVICDGKKIYTVEGLRAGVYKNL